MHTQLIGKNLYQVELGTGGYKELISSFILLGQKPILIEAGPTNSVPALLEALDELGIKREDVQYVAVTHVHLDHGGGAGTLLKQLPNAKVIVHPKGAPHIANPERLWPASQSVLGPVSEIFGKPEPIPENRIVPMTEGNLDLGDDGKLTVIETPGHASHNLSFYESFNDGVFPGDAAGTYHPGWDVIVPTTPPPFYLETALASLDKLISLKPASLYFSHFGKATDGVRRLTEYKEQLKLWGEIALEGVKNSQSTKQICEAILERDPVMHRLADYFSEHTVYSITVLDNSVGGFVEYAKKTIATTKPQ